jgi:hypothetical protein
VIGIVSVDYEPELSEPLGGSILLNQGDYTIPVGLPEDKAREIVEDQAEDYGHRLHDNEEPYFSIETGEGERYDLIYLPNREGLQAVGHYSEEQGKVLGFTKINELLEGGDQ